MIKQSSLMTGLLTISVMLLAFPATADENVIMSQIWQRYLTTCSQILGVTDTVLSEFPLSEPGYVLAKSDGETRLIYGWASDDYTRSSSVEMGISHYTISTTCSVGRNGLPPRFDPLKASEFHRSVVAEVTSLTIDGGLVSFEAGSPQSIQNFTSGEELYSFNIYGAFAPMEIISIVDVTSDNTTVFHMVTEQRMETE